MEELTHVMARMTQMMEPNQTQNSTNVSKFRTMGENEDIEHYLTLFERHMILNDMPEDESTRQLAPVLTGRAGAAYNDVEPRAPYAILKQAILQRYEINPEASQVKLRQMRFKIDDDIAEHVSRVDALVKRWLIPVSKPDLSDKERLEELEMQIRRETVMEQVLTGLPRDLQARIDAQGPCTMGELKQCIREYQLKRKEEGMERKFITSSRNQVHLKKRSNLL